VILLNNIITEYFDLVLVQRYEVLRCHRQSVFNVLKIELLSKLKQLVFLLFELAFVRHCHRLFIKQIYFRYLLRFSFTNCMLNIKLTVKFGIKLRLFNHLCI